MCEFASASTSRHRSLTAVRQTSRFASRTQHPRRRRRTRGGRRAAVAPCRRASRSVEGGPLKGRLSDVATLSSSLAYCNARSQIPAAHAAGHLDPSRLLRHTPHSARAPTQHPPEPLRAAAISWAEARRAGTRPPRTSGASRCASGSAAWW